MWENLKIELKLQLSFVVMMDSKICSAFDLIESQTIKQKN